MLRNALLVLTVSLPIFAAKRSAITLLLADNKRMHVSALQFNMLKAHSNMLTLMDGDTDDTPIALDQVHAQSIDLLCALIHQKDIKRTSNSIMSRPDYNIEKRLIKKAQLCAPDLLSFIKDLNYLDSRDFLRAAARVFGSRAAKGEFADFYFNNFQMFQELIPDIKQLLAAHIPQPCGEIIVPDILMMHERALSDECMLAIEKATRVILGNKGTFVFFSDNILRSDNKYSLRIYNVKTEKLLTVYTSIELWHNSQILLNNVDSLAAIEISDDHQNFDIYSVPDFKLVSTFSHVPTCCGKPNRNFFQMRGEHLYMTECFKCGDNAQKMNVFSKTIMPIAKKYTYYKSFSDSFARYYLTLDSKCISSWINDVYNKRVVFIQASNSGDYYCLEEEKSILRKFSYVGIKQKKHFDKTFFQADITHFLPYLPFDQAMFIVCARQDKDQFDAMLSGDNAELKALYESVKTPYAWHIKHHQSKTNQNITRNK